MTNLYTEWKKLRDDVQNASARLYYEKNENTESKYDEAVEALVNFEKENGIPLKADEAKVKKCFVHQTNDEWRKTCSTEEFAEWISNLAYACMRCGMSNGEAYCHTGYCVQDEEDAEKWLKEAP